MPKPMIRIHDVAADTIIDREMTAAEIASLEADAAALTNFQELSATKAEDKAVLLDRLGITAKEAELLLS